MQCVKETAMQQQQDVLKEKMRSSDTDISEVCDYIVPDQRSSLNFILLFLFVWFFLVFFTIENAGGMLVCSACQGCRS